MFLARRVIRTQSAYDVRNGTLDVERDTAAILGRRVDGSLCELTTVGRPLSRHTLRLVLMQC